MGAHIEPLGAHDCLKHAQYRKQENAHRGPELLCSTPLVAGEAEDHAGTVKHACPEMTKGVVAIAGRLAEKA